MLAEILVYMALFVALFGSAFVAAFQTVDAVRYLQVQKNAVDDLYFLQSRLDTLVRSTPDWSVLSSDVIIKSISAPASLIESLSSEISETATSSVRILFVTININKNTYKFSYVQEK